MSCSRTDTPARAVSSNQTGPHPRLANLLARHRQATSRRPRANHADYPLRVLAARAAEHGGPLVIDSGCGSGESTRQLAARHPAALVIGIDKSAHRLTRAEQRAPHPDNLLYIRADLLDCWTWLVVNDLPVLRHYLLYPNPWPKQHQLMRRWHAHPIMPTLVKVSASIELRTNWAVYAAEFAYSLNVLGHGPSEVERWRPTTPLSAFERKYARAGHALFRVCSTSA